jgi:hypothetical protein
LPIRDRRTEKRSLPVGELMQQQQRHLSSMMNTVIGRVRLLGYNPDNFDLLFYYAEKHRPRAS